MLKLLAYLYRCVFRIVIVARRYRVLLKWLLDIFSISHRVTAVSSAVVVVVVVVVVMVVKSCWCLRNVY